MLPDTVNAAGGLYSVRTWLVIGMDWASG